MMKNMHSQPKEEKRALSLKISRTYADKFEFRSITETETDIKQDFSLTVSFPDTDKKLFDVKFDARIRCENNKILHVTYIALFEASEEIDRQKFASSPFAHVNAPAIAYPFLRSFVATIILNAGYAPVLLPSVNFQALFNGKKQAQAK